jgi:NADPH-dependent 2,4-dienoyl-CoA reductase/sulfur reductase-like enzyme
MVIGGGPGGLNAAWTAAKRGHDVHLYEKRPVLGGQLVPGTRTAYKREMQSLIEFQKKQAEIYGVKCHMGQEITAEAVQREKPDVVILATGSEPVIPPIEGISQNHVVTFDVVLNGHLLDNCKTVVIGGGATGCEVAYHLSDRGIPVTVVEMSDKIGGDLESITKRMLLRKLKEKNVDFLTGHTVLKVTADGVVVTATDGRAQNIEAQRIVIAIGIRSNDGIHAAIRSLGFDTRMIGDCLKPRSAKQAIYEGTKLGLEI